MDHDDPRRSLEREALRVLKSIDFNLHDPVVSAKLDQILTALQSLGDKLMATLADIQNDVASESTVIDGVVTLLGELSTQLAAAIAANDPAALQAIVTSIDANKAKLAAAVAANTPAAPAGNPSPPPVTP